MSDDESGRRNVDISERQFPRSAPSLPTHYPDLDDIDQPPLPNTEPNSASSSSNASSSYYGSPANSSPARSYRSNHLGVSKRPNLRETTTLTIPKRALETDDPGTPTPVQEPPPPPSAISPATPLAKDRPTSVASSAFTHRRRATVHHGSIPIDPDLAAYIPMAVQRALLEERRRALPREGAATAASAAAVNGDAGEPLAPPPPPSGGGLVLSAGAIVPEHAVLPPRVVNGGRPKGHTRTMSDAAHFRPPFISPGSSSGSVTILSVERRASCDTTRPNIPPPPLERSSSFKKPFSGLRNMFSIGAGFVKGHNRTRSQQYDRQSPVFRGAGGGKDMAEPRLSFTFPRNNDAPPVVRR